LRAFVFLEITKISSPEMQKNKTKQNKTQKAKTKKQNKTNKS